MHFSGRVRAGEAMPLYRGLLAAGKGKRVEVIVDGGGGKGFAFAWALTALEVQASSVLGKARVSKEAPDFVCPTFGSLAASVMPGLESKHTLTLVDSLWEDKGNLHAGVQSGLVKSHNSGGFPSCANRR